MFNAVENCTPAGFAPAIRGHQDDESAFLDYLLDDVWDILEQGVRVPIAAAHTPTLATLRLGIPTVRTVVLRAVSRAAAMILVHTDRHSAKVQELLAQPACSLHIFDSGRRVQLRFDTLASVHVDDELADAEWRRMQSQAQVMRLRRPGSAEVQTAQAASLALDDVDGFSDAGRRQQFAVIALHVSAIEWLQLHSNGQRRARFELGETTTARWLEA